MDLILEHLFMLYELDEEERIKYFQQGIRYFWAAYGRHELPWRQTSDPWRILLAEVLLRKTTSIQAAGVYNQLHQYTPQEILSLHIDELANIMKPLGIHQVRAAQILTIAHAVLDTGYDIFNSDELLRKLPGIGRYISNTVRCCAFGVPAPALDTNMIRILDRVFGWKSARKRPREDRKLWETAERIMPEEKPREFNWGVLDFASAVCTYRNPKCSHCPINKICNYYSFVHRGSLQNV